MARDVLFAVLCGMLCAKGRDAALVGGGMGDARLAFARIMPEGDDVHAYFEVPLTGKRGLDVHCAVDQAVSAEAVPVAADHAWRSSLAWFSGIAPVKTAEGEVLVMAEADVSTDASARPGTYLIQRDRADLVGPWLKAIGEPLWLDAWEAYRAMLPPGWQTTYVGVFPGRADGLLRVNAHPVGSGAAGLDRAISSLGLLADEGSLALCSDLLCGVRGLDLQLDIDREGRPAPDFALEAYLESVPHFPSPWESGAGERILSLMEAHGAADDRWRALEDVDVSRCVALPTQEGMRSCAVSLRTFSAKVRFLGGRPVLAKAYLRGDASIASASNGAAVSCDAGNGSFGNGWSSSSDGMLLPESRMSEVSNSSSGCSSFR